MTPTHSSSRPRGNAVPLILTLIFGLGIGTVAGHTLSGKKTATAPADSAAQPSSAPTEQAVGPEGATVPFNAELIRVVTGTVTEVGTDTLTMTTTVRYADPSKPEQARTLRIGVTGKTVIAREVRLNTDEIEKREAEVAKEKERLAAERPQGDPSAQPGSAPPPDEPTELRTTSDSVPATLASIKAGEVVTVTLAEDVDSRSPLVATEIRIAALHGAPPATSEAKAQTEFPLVPPEERYEGAQ